MIKTELSITKAEITEHLKAAKPAQGITLTKDKYLHCLDLYHQWGGNLVTVGGYVGFAQLAGLTIPQAETIWTEIDAEAGTAEVKK